LIALPAQTTEFTNWFRHAREDHIMKKQVPEFHAWRCHGKGIKEMMKPMNAKMENSGYVGSVTSMLNKFQGCPTRE